VFSEKYLKVNLRKSEQEKEPMMKRLLNSLKHLKVILVGCEVYRENQGKSGKIRENQGKSGKIREKQNGTCVRRY